MIGKCIDGCCFDCADFLAQHRSVDEEYVHSLGVFLKKSVVLAMASNSKHIDDVSIFVGTLEATDALGPSTGILDDCLFAGRLSHGDIQQGVERFISNASRNLKPASDHSEDARGVCSRSQELGKRPGCNDPQTFVKHAKQN